MKCNLDLPDYLTTQVPEQDLQGFVTQAIQEKLQRDPGFVQQASLKLIQLGQGLMVSQVLFSLAKLGIPTLLDQGSHTVTTIAKVAGCDACTLRRYLRAAATMGVFRESGDDRFEHTPLSQKFDLLASCYFDERAYQAWNQATYTLQSGKPGWPVAYGMSFYEYLTSSPEIYSEFSRWNTRTTVEWLLPLVDAYDFSTFKRLVDVGGGEGNTLARILANNPHLQGVLFDQPQVVESARGIIDQVGVGDRCEYVGGSFFERIPSGGDLYILSRVLLNWSDEQALAILNNCRRAMGTTSKLLVIDVLIPSPEHPSYQTLVFNDLNLLMTMGGTNRTQNEWHSLIKQAGFNISCIVPAPIPSLLSLIEAKPRT